MTVQPGLCGARRPVFSQRGSFDLFAEYEYENGRVIMMIIIQMIIIIIIIIIVIIIIIPIKHMVFIKHGKKDNINKQKINDINIHTAAHLNF